MSPLTEPTRLVLRRTWQQMDPDAAAYITAVEAADTAAGSPGGLEERTKIAIDNFVLGCKADGIWSAIKASCILAGARTLNGALQPLVGVAPTPFNFLPADYNRKTGLVGDGSTKYLNSNRNNNADPQNSKHLAVYASTPISGVLIGAFSGSGFGVGASWIARDSTTTFLRINAGASNSTTEAAPSGFIGLNRSSSSTISKRLLAVTTTGISQASAAPDNLDTHVFRQGAGTSYSDSRLAFYSVGESINLALLDARVTNLINAFATAIP